MATEYPRVTRRQTLAMLLATAGIIAADRVRIHLNGDAASPRYERPSDRAQATSSPQGGSATAVTAPRLLDLASIAHGWEVIDVAVGPAGDPLVLLWEVPEIPSPAPDEGENAEFQIEESYAFRVLHLIDGTLKTIDLPATDAFYDFVQPFAGEGYVLVESWPREGRPNTDVYDPNGRFLRSFSVGGGISHIQATTDGRLWVGYFDEGVIDGGIEGGIAQEGVVCFNPDGSPRFRYNEVADERGVEGILDCYAMNATDEDVWLFTYVDFPLVRVSGQKIVDYRTDLTERAPIAGAGAVAVSGDRLLFASPYDAPDNLYLLSLSEPGWTALAPVDEGGAPLQSFRTFGRGSRLYLWTEHALHVVELATLAL